MTPPVVNNGAVQKAGSEGQEVLECQRLARM